MTATVIAAIAGLVSAMIGAALVAKWAADLEYKKALLSYYANYLSTCQLIRAKLAAASSAANCYNEMLEFIQSTKDPTVPPVITNVDIHEAEHEARKAHAYVEKNLPKYEQLLLEEFREYTRICLLERRTERRRILDNIRDCVATYPKLEINDSPFADDDGHYLVDDKTKLLEQHIYNLDDDIRKTGDLSIASRSARRTADRLADEHDLVTPWT